VASLQGVWIGFTAAFVKLAYGAFYGALAATEQAWHAMKVVWIEGVSFLRKLWTEFSAWHAKAVEAAADAMVKAWIWAREKTGAITPEQAQFERSYSRASTISKANGLTQIVSRRSMPPRNSTMPRCRPRASGMRAN
jgi:hypothetical protein